MKIVEGREISQAVIRRLPRYYRYLGELLENGVERISSNDLSKRMKVTASQIRQDLNNFGGFGQQGYGYNVKYLYTEIGKILGLEEDHNDKASLGYISFLDNIKNRTFIEELSQNYNFMAELGYTYFRETITIRFERDGLLYIRSFTKNHF